MLMSFNPIVSTAYFAQSSADALEIDSGLICSLDVVILSALLVGSLET
jgi:hypothetical protein